MTSERRKEQNRQAQKNYKARQKARLQRLEASAKRTGYINANVIATFEGEANRYANQSRLAESSACQETLADLIHDPETDIDDTVRHQLLTGALDIRTVLKEGLATLSRSARRVRTLPPSKSDETITEIRTDQIYILSIPSQSETQPPVSMFPPLPDISDIPDIRANRIRTQPLCTVTAIRHNAEMLGITFSTLFEPDAISPFLRTGSASDRPDHHHHHHLIPAGADDLSDLAPTIAQTRYSHHPWIDTIPCPTFRQNVLACLATDPPLIDEDDICADIERGGLVCWGGSVARAVGATDSAIGTGLPSSARSWEAQIWFLQKWWFVLGGDTGELVKSTWWWRRLRGDSVRLLSNTANSID